MRLVPRPSSVHCAVHAAAAIAHRVCWLQCPSREQHQRQPIHAHSTGRVALPCCRVVQVQQLLREVEHMQERHMQLQQQQQPPGAGSSNGSRSHTAAQPPAVLLCGDFNTTPDSDTVRVSIAACITLLMTGI